MRQAALEAGLGTLKPHSRTQEDRLKDLNLIQRAIALVTSGVLMSYIFTGNLYLFFLGLLIGVVFSLWQRWQSTSPLEVSQLEEDA